MQNPLTWTILPHPGPYWTVRKPWLWLVLGWRQSELRLFPPAGGLVPTPATCCDPGTWSARPDLTGDASERFEGFWSKGFWLPQVPKWLMCLSPIALPPHPLGIWAFKSLRLNCSPAWAGRLCPHGLGGCPWCWWGGNVCRAVPSRRGFNAPNREMCFILAMELNYRWERSQPSVSMKSNTRYMKWCYLFTIPYIASHLTLFTGNTVNNLEVNNEARSEK